MGLPTKQRESERLIAEAAKEQAACEAYEHQESAAKADYDRAFAAGDADAMIAAEARQKAHGALAAKQRDKLVDIRKRVATAIDAEEEADFLAYCEDLDRQEERRGKTYGRDFERAASALTAFLAGDTAKTRPVVEASKRLVAMGRSPILTAEERARTTAGRIEPAAYEDRVVWRKHEGGPEVVVFKRTKSGELVPAEGGAVRSIERVCVRQERHIAPHRPEPLVKTVVIPGFAAGADPLWPKPHS